MVMHVKTGALVDIDPVFYGYDNIEPQWHHGLFIVINVRYSRRKAADGSRYVVCSVLTPEGKLYDFYDYEIRNIDNINYTQDT